MGCMWKERPSGQSLRPYSGSTVPFNLLSCGLLPACSLGSSPTKHVPDPGTNQAGVLPGTSCTCPDPDLPRAGCWLRCHNQSGPFRPPSLKWPRSPPHTDPSLCSPEPLHRLCSTWHNLKSPCPSAPLEWEPRDCRHCAHLAHCCVSRACNMPDAYSCSKIFFE